MVRVILYIVTALLIILTIFGPQEDRYQLVFLMGGVSLFADFNLF